MVDKVYNMGEISLTERKEISGLFSDRQDSETIDIVDSLAVMPYSPRDLEALTREISDYLQLTGNRLVMVDDVEGGVYRQLALGAEGAGIIKREQRGTVEVDYDRLRGILDMWDNDLGYAGVSTVSSENALAFIKEVHRKTRTE